MGLPAAAVLMAAVPAEAQQSIGVTAVIVEPFPAAGEEIVVNAVGNRLQTVHQPSSRSGTMVLTSLWLTAEANPESLPHEAQAVIVTRVVASNS